MGSQIAVAMNHSDELVMVAELKKKHDLLCCPRILPKNHIDLSALGQCGETSQLIFHRANFDKVAASVSELKKIDWEDPEMPETFTGKYHVSFSAGYVVEWSRTVKDSDGVWLPGRCYCFPGKEPDEAVRALFGSICRIVRRRALPIPGRKRRVYVWPGLQQEISSDFTKVL